MEACTSLFEVLRYEAKLNNNIFKKGKGIFLIRDLKKIAMIMIGYFYHRVVLIRLFLAQVVDVRCLGEEVYWLQRICYWKQFIIKISIFYNSFITNLGTLNNRDRTL